MSKSQSGLGSVKRDWSANPPASSQEIEWLPTPPKPVALPQPAVSSSGVELTGKQKRLRDIQNAINNRTTPTIAHPFAKPKRASDTEYPEASGSVPPTKKPRQLPPGYREDDPMTRSTQFTSSSRAAAPPSKKIGKVFLSSEQKQILKLAEEGHSLFYTGSAGTGKSVLLREIIKSLRKKVRQVH
ncbi:hypothetical protein B0H15DRAFT_141771 [Mycena belliarum]|uniref:ATP-dependent DNA helicase n=1 Tax=Mycena belliarum TaxID=1033014 RepID=A0AAD6XDR0_9AGAR|nr:hypothetical protein B0H15DRAFT_141771 [Mycena belliae]